MEESKAINSKLIGSFIFFVMFLLVGVFELLIKKSGYVSLVWFARKIQV